jgi:hypothetical protein
MIQSVIVSEAVNPNGQVEAATMERLDTETRYPTPRCAGVAGNTHAPVYMQYQGLLWKPQHRAHFLSWECPTCRRTGFYDPKGVK